MSKQLLSFKSILTLASSDMPLETCTNYIPFVTTLCVFAQACQLLSGESQPCRTRLKHKAEYQTGIYVHAW